MKAIKAMRKFEGSSAEFDSYYQMTIWKSGSHFFLEACLFH